MTWWKSQSIRHGTSWSSHSKASKYDWLRQSSMPLLTVPFKFSSVLSLFEKVKFWISVKVINTEILPSDCLQYKSMVFFIKAVEFESGSYLFCLSSLENWTHFYQQWALISSSPLFTVFTQWSLDVPLPSPPRHLEA